jgi:hypothetical protein
MKYSKLALAASLFAVAATTMAATAVAPDHRIRIWDGPYAIADSGYMIGTHPDLGTVKSLKYSLTTSAILNTINYVQNTGGLDMSNKNLTSFPYNGGNYERLSEIGIPSGECVAFAKSMTGVAGTPTWYKGNSLMSYLVSNISGYSVSPYLTLKPGTMIAHFQGLQRYPQLPPYGHVAIFLSWSKNAQGMIDGINVVNENLVWKINGVSGAKGIIQKHKIPLTGSTTPTYNSSGYHVVDVRWNKKYHYT